MGAGHLTAVGAVDLIVTNLAVIQVTPASLLLGELAPGATFGYVRSLTESVLIPAPDLREMEL
jgi:acyl CoA:acetate/3-ketoacid CoA transferase beta subunit